jgi:hypothetical protein
MYNKNLQNIYKFHVLIPPSPFSTKAKKRVRSILAPLCEAERACPVIAGGWGECMIINDRYTNI